MLEIVSNFVAFLENLNFKVRAFWKKETETKTLIYLFLNFPPSNIEYWLRAFHEFFQQESQ